ncbi:MAG: virulence RhuM family protein [Planctomycetes bacterium]|nr:virulence RhuM family protein [Planctomycetota bacterium]
MTRKRPPAARGQPESDQPGGGQIVLYQTEDGRQRIEVRLEGQTVWLTQAAMAELFQTTTPNINIHLKNIYAEGELIEEATIKEYLIVRSEGARQVERRVKHYNLEAIIAVGYRVRSHRGTQFRQWATERLREFIVKGFVLDDERLSEPGGIDYFDELLERIRAIRASEKRFYHKVRDIYALSADYDAQHPMTQEFFATVQNKMLYAATGMTAAELINHRANSSLPNMGLTTWKGAGRGRALTKADTTIAKNYLNRQEMRTLELLVGQYLDFAELQAQQRRIMYMADWKAKLDDFLRLNNQEILTHAGKISKELAEEAAHAQYGKFARNRRRIEADHADEELRQQVRRLTEGPAGDNDA